MFALTLWKHEEFKKLLGFAKDQAEAEEKVAEIVKKYGADYLRDYGYSIRIELAI